MLQFFVECVDVGGFVHVCLWVSVCCYVLFSFFSIFIQNCLGKTTVDCLRILFYKTCRISAIRIHSSPFSIIYRFFSLRFFLLSISILFNWFTSCHLLFVPFHWMLSYYLLSICFFPNELKTFAMWHRRAK